MTRTTIDLQPDGLPEVSFHTFGDFVTVDFGHGDNPDDRTSVRIYLRNEEEARELANEIVEAINREAIDKGKAGNQAN